MDHRIGGAALAERLWAWKEARKARKEARNALPGWQGAFRDVQRFVTFLGPSRSGSSLLGFLLNAHRQVVLSQELDALAFVRRGFTREELFSAIMLHDQMFAEGGFTWHGFDYRVPECHQGTFSTLRVIGDKSGNTAWLRDDPGALIELEDRVDAPLYALLVVRNPFDNVATMNLKTRFTLDQAIDLYSIQTRAVASVAVASDPSRILEVRNDAIIDEPNETLGRIARFLDLDEDRHWQKQAAGIVFASPNRSRDKVEWSSRQVDAVEQLIDNVPYLAGYGWDSK